MTRPVDPPALLLVLDDGAYMLEALAGLKRQLPHLAIVELDPVFAGWLDAEFRWELADEAAILKTDSR